MGHQRLTPTKGHMPFEISAALSTVKLLIREANTLETKERARELQEQLLELWEEHAALKQEAEGLRTALKTKGELQYDDNAYWLSASRTAKDGPFCPRCWEVDQRMLRMIDYHNGFFQCPQCKTGRNVEGFSDRGRIDSDYDPFRDT
jgi:regulator of replication initiation timing